MWSRREWLMAVAGMLVAGRARSASRPAAIAKQLVVRQHEPFCAEGPLAALAESWLTPLERFFVLDHAEVPAVSHELEIEGRVVSVEELLARYPIVTSSATLVCAGNRRQEHDARRRVSAPPIWGPGAVGNASFTGVRLADVLRGRARWVTFEGADGFAGSVPLAAAREALLAFGMNGLPLALVHGFPLRAIVPGLIGARSVKWLRRVELSDLPTRNHHFLEGHRLGDRPIWHYPMTAVVCRAQDDGAEGYAMGEGSGRDPLATVEVSVDTGRTWQRARLDPRAAPGCWRLWRWRGRATTTVTVRAISASGRRSPAVSPWNEGGYLYDGWHTLPVS